MFTEVIVEKFLALLWRTMPPPSIHRAVSCLYMAADVRESWRDATSIVGWDLPLSWDCCTP